jgi:hypothetical protein
MYFVYNDGIVVVEPGSRKIVAAVNVNDAPPKELMLIIFTVMGMAFFAGYEGGILLGIEVYFISVISSSLLTLLITLFDGPYEGYVVSALSIVGLVVVAYFPGQIGTYLGSPLLATVSIILWILFVFGLARIGVLAGRPGHGIKTMLLCVVALWITGSILAFVTEHRHGYPSLDYVHESSGSQFLTPLPSLATAYKKWDKQVDPKTLVLVAAAGGGIRASYWTSLILTRLADRVEGLRGKLFAASGVSGGSLGLGLFYSLLSAPVLACAAVEPDSRRKRLEPCVSAFHENDFLAGPLGATLAGYPANAVFMRLFPSRNLALETGWERAWRKAVGEKNKDAFSSPMTALWSDDGHRPLLLLNATSTRSGERAIAADVRIVEPDWIRLRRKCHLNIVEEINLPLSAAIGASARFPLLSDWGWIRQPKSKGCDKLEGVADGGFYENYGAETLIDLLDWLADPEGGHVNLRNVRLVVIQITSNPSIEMGCLIKKLDADGWSTSDAKVTYDYCSPKTQVAAGDAQKPTSLEASGTTSINDAPGAFDFALATLASLRERLASQDPIEPGVVKVAMQASEASGIGVAERLRQLVCSVGGSYYHFSMTGVKDIPLGWAISKTSRDRLSAILDNAGTAKSRLERLATELNTGAAQGQCLPTERRPPLGASLTWRWRRRARPSVMPLTGRN